MRRKWRPMKRKTPWIRKTISQPYLSTVQSRIPSGRFLRLSSSATS